MVKKIFVSQSEFYFKLQTKLNVQYFHKLKVIQFGKYRFIGFIGFILSLLKRFISSFGKKICFKEIETGFEC